MDITEEELVKIKDEARTLGQAVMCERLSVYFAEKAASFFLLEKTELADRFRSECKSLRDRALVLRSQLPYPLGTYVPGKE